VNETSLTVCGNVCTNPRHVVRDDGLAITSFRIASTIRKFDRGERQWVDGETTFLTVSCFRALATNVATSVQKGQRVMVTGRLRVRPWVKGDRSGTSVEVEAHSVGHDLGWGTADFTRIARTERIEQPGRAEADELAAQVELDHRMWELREAGPGDESDDGTSGGDGFGGHELDDESELVSLRAPAAASA
jgi:single-strand DNA-binding protein